MAGVGTIVLHTSSKKARTLRDVQYVSLLAHNLLSVANLLKIGFNVNFAVNECVIRERNTNTLVARVKITTNELFPLVVNKVVEAQVVHGGDKNSMLQHRRYNHLNSQNLQLLS